MRIFDESGYNCDAGSLAVIYRFCPDALEEFRLFNRIVERIMCMT
jgi:hypothetical protein